jgi:hypothetical protein
MDVWMDGVDGWIGHWELDGNLLGTYWELGIY